MSTSTVSLVMNEKGSVSPETRRRVRQIAERLGYVPTQAARRLVTRRTGNIGFVVREDHFTRSEPFYTRIFLGTEFEARHRGLYVLLTTIPDAYDTEAHRPRFLRERNVDGILLAGKVDATILDEVSRAGLPAVTIDFERPPFPAVVIDNQQGGRQATMHLIDRGHGRIAFLGTDLGHPSLQARLEGYRLALNQEGLAYRPEYVLDLGREEPTRPAGIALAERLLALDPRPTAAFCVNDAVALGVLETVRQAGLRIPQEFAIVGFDDVAGAATCVPALTTVRVFKEQLGELALRYLCDLIDGGPPSRDRYGRSTHTIHVATEFVQRSTT